jgi:hypothetical protein
MLNRKVPRGLLLSLLLNMGESGKIINTLQKQQALAMLADNMLHFFYATQ